MTGDISEFTCADFLQPGSKTPVAARMSTVTHEKGCVLAQDLGQGFVGVMEQGLGVAALGVCFDLVQVNARGKACAILLY